MKRIVPCTFSDAESRPHIDDALVEFIRYDEDGVIVNKIVNIFLPEYIPTQERESVRQEVIRQFHNGEGYNI